MVHSKEFNEERRKRYAEGRRLGLTPREAGHLYNERQSQPKIQAALAKPPSLVPKMRGSLEQRLDEAMRKTPGKNVGYIFHNKAVSYVKTKVKFRSRETGQEETRYITLALPTRDIPTRDATLKMVDTIIAKHSGQYIYREYDVAAITYEELQQYPDTGVAYQSAVGPTKGQKVVRQGQARLD